MIRSLFNKFIDLTSSFYDPFFKVFMRDEEGFRKKLVEFAKLKEGEDVLDVGCGTGTLCEAILKSYPKCHVKGLDLSEKMVKKAQTKVPEAEFKAGSITKIPFEGFDVVFSNFMFHLVDPAERSQALKEIRRVLKDGGRYVSAEWSGLGMNCKLLKDNGFKVIERKEEPVSKSTRIPLKKTKIIYRIATV